MKLCKVVLLFLIVLLSTEVTMARNNKPVMDDGNKGGGRGTSVNQANYRTPTSSAKKNEPAWVNNPASAAWANYNQKKQEEEDAINNLKQSMQPSIFNANVPQETINQAQNLINANNRRNVFNQINKGETFTPASIRPPAYGGMYNPTVTNPAFDPPVREPAYGGMYNPTATNPAFDPPVREPAYGGTYNPTVTNPAFTLPAWMRPVSPDPSKMVNEYVGQPVNDSMSDTLRSMKPIFRGNSPTFSDTLRNIQAGIWKASTIPWATKTPNGSTGGGGGSGGFGTTYGGNWGGGGGSGGTGWTDYGDGNNPAWINYLQSLYSWNIK